VGIVDIAGSVTPYSDGTISITASGYDIEGNADAFHFLYTPLQNDGEISAYIDMDRDAAPSDWAKVGVMIRGDLDADAENYAFVIRPKKGSASQYRPAKNYGGTLSSWVDEPAYDDGFFQGKRHINYVDKYPTPYRARYLQPGKWLKARRLGESVYIYSSDDGQCWNLRARNDDINFGSQTFAGIVLSSHAPYETVTATVSNISVNETPLADVNSDCERAQVDGQIAPPSDWIIAPGVFGGDTWSLTEVNPNPDQRPASCRSRYGAENRRYYDDSTLCPAEITQAPWTRPGYTLTAIWEQNQPGGFGDRGVGRSEYTQKPFYKKEFWLRKEVSLTPADFDKIVFWGRWSDSASIFVNGVLATNIYDSNMKEAYHYLGLRDEARAALIDGTNVITAHVKCIGCQNAYADFGLARHDKLGNYPMNNAFPNNDPNSKTARVAKVVTDYTKEKALLGASVAYRIDGVLVEAQSLGWRDSTLEEAMPVSPIMRLASVDKGPTRAAIRKLLEDLENDENITFDKDEKVFGPDGLLSDIEPLGGAYGTNVTDITVAHLHDHVSGLSGINGEEQAWQDEVAFKYDIPASEVTTEHLISLWISQPTIFVPGTDVPFDVGYSSHGHAVLRYLVERLYNEKNNTQDKTLNDFFAEEMNAPDLIVARERVKDRQYDTNERITGNQLIGKEIRARWFELDEYLALSASTEGLTEFFDEYLYDDNGGLAIEDKIVGANGGGSMDGTHAGAVVELVGGVKEAYAYIWNSDKPPSKRFEIKRTIAQYGDVYPGTCDPTAPESVGQYFLIDSLSKPQWYLTTGDLNDPTNSGNLTLQAAGDVYTFRGTEWRFEAMPPEDGVIPYRIFNSYTSDQLHVVDGVVVTGDDPADPASAQWILHDHVTHFRLENRANSGQFLYVDTSDTPRIAYDNGTDSFKWYICN